MFWTQLLEITSLYLSKITEYVFAYGNPWFEKCVNATQPVLEPIVLSAVFWGNKQWILAKHSMKHIYASYPVVRNATDAVCNVWYFAVHIVNQVQCMLNGTETKNGENTPHLYVFSPSKLEKTWMRSSIVSPSVAKEWLDTILHVSDTTGGYIIPHAVLQKNVSVDNTAAQIPTTSSAITEEEEKECVQYAKTESENKKSERLVILRADNKTYSRVFYDGKTEDAIGLETKKSRVEFLAVQFRTADETISIDLPTEFYLANNHLFSGAFLYFYMTHGMQIKDFKLPETYTVYIMDDDIQQHELKPNQYVILRERGYEIHQLYEKIE